MVDREILWIFPTVFLVAVTGFSLLIFVQKSRGGYLKKILHISARKSTSNAVQLGGLPLSLSIITGVCFLISHKYFNSFFSEFDFYSIKYWLVSAGIIVIYGFLDDKFELRPIVKLSLQITSICLFAVLESRVLFPKWGALAFVVLSFWGLGVLNGSNLLDGLDTLTIKLGCVTFFTYLVIAWNFKIGSVALSSTLILSCLGAFYIFNKEPAKVHLGEIGGSFIGFSSLLVSCFVYSHIVRGKYGNLNALAMASIPLSLPMVELGVSFLRRIYNKKSPFKGDKFHLHHILRNYYGFSPSYASSLYALGYGLVMVAGLTFTHFLGPVLGLPIVIFLLTFGYVMVGKKHWKGDNTLDLKPAALFDYLLKKDVGVISSLEVDDFHIEIIGGEGDLRDLVDDTDEKEEGLSNNKGSKKAA